jgi:uncharacterized protein YuzE
VAVRCRVAFGRVRVTFDRSANAAYIYLTPIAEGEPARQHVVDEPHARGMIVLDFDKKGRLIGIEVLDATKALPDEVLRTAERL